MQPTAFSRYRTFPSPWKVLLCSFPIDPRPSLPRGNHYSDFDHHKHQYFLKFPRWDRAETSKEWYQKRAETSPPAPAFASWRLRRVQQASMANEVVLYLSLSLPSQMSELTAQRLSWKISRTTELSKPAAISQAWSSLIQDNIFFKSFILWLSCHYLLAFP